MRLSHEAHDECQDGHKDGHQHVTLRLVDPAVRQQVGSENHGIDHEHLLGYGAEHPHGDKNVKNLVYRKKQPQRRKGIALALKIDVNEFGDAPCQRQQRTSHTERQEILRLDGQSGEMHYPYGGPDEDGGEDEV